MNEQEQLKKEIKEIVLKYRTCESDSLAVDAEVGALLHLISSDEIEREVYQEIFPDKDKDFQKWVIAWFKRFGEINRSWLFDEYKTTLTKSKEGGE